MKDEYEIYYIGPEGAKVQVLRKTLDESTEISTFDPGLDDPGTPTAYR